jgi:radical SAM-linked protein
MPHDEQSLGEYMDVVLAEKADPAALLAALQRTLPEGFGAAAVSEVPLNAPSLMSLNHGHDYTIRLPHEAPDAVAERVRAIASAEALPIERAARPGKPRPKKVDLRPSIASIALADEGEVTVRLVVPEDGSAGAKAREVVALLTDAPERAVVVRRDTLTRRGGGLVSLSEWRASPS